MEVGTRLPSMEVGTRLPNVPHFDRTLVSSCLDDQIKDIIQHVKKDWSSKKLARATYDGTSNTSFGYFSEENTKDIIIFRIYGEKSELLINRSLELQSFELLSINRLAPDIICTFSNGYCYQFVPGKSISMQDLKRTEILRDTACLVARIHSIKVPSVFLENSKQVGTAFDHIERYLGLISSSHFQLNKKRYSGLALSIESLKNEIIELRETAKENDGSAVELVFCHNDINCANLIYDKDADKLSCIDYEYACVNYAAYDIGNFFCEFAGGSDMDYVKDYPTQETQIKWISYYLKEKYLLAGKDQESIKNEEIQQTYQRVNLFALVSHLLWGCWAMVQSEISNIDFDFIAYAVLRIAEYFRKKDEFLSMFIVE